MTEWAPLIAALADQGRREAAALEVARSLGADALVILVDDVATEALLPAPGFRQTLPGGAGWRAFLPRIREPGVHTGEVGHPVATQLRHAVALTSGGISLVFIGDALGPAIGEPLRPFLPLLACMFKAEQSAALAHGELQAARTHARESESLARALDVSRAEVERTLIQLEEQSRAADEARARAEGATRAKDEFLAMLGHELRNPLSPILTALQLMRLKNQTSREQEIIERQVGSLMRLVDDLLDVARITRGKIELRRERVELAEVAARAIEMASPILEKKQQVLDVRVSTSGLMVDADPSRLAQVVSNLLTNAAKYSDAESKITFTAERSGEVVVIKVKDQGVGIAPELLTRIFEPFVQQRQAVDRSRGGLGLGLAIVRSLVELHGGNVRAHSEGEGRGAEFVVELPAAPRETATAAPADQLLAMGLHRLGGPDATRVLVVDDNIDAAALIAEALGVLGYQVRTASDGPSGLRIAADFRPQLALLDIGLPVMDGYELAGQLRRQTMGPLRLVAVTGYGQPADQQRSHAAGFDAHLVKPVTLEQLQRVLS